MAEQHAFVPPSDPPPAPPPAPTIGAQEIQEKKAGVESAARHFPHLASAFVAGSKAQRWKCKYCNEEFFAGSSTRARAHFDHKDSSIKSCSKAPSAVFEAIMREAANFQVKRKKSSNSSTCSITQQSLMTTFLPSPITKPVQEKLEDELALFFVTANIPFRGIDNEHLTNALNLVRQLPPGKIIVPNRKQLAGPILDRLGFHAAEEGASFRTSAAHNGLSICCDGWSTRNNIGFINYMAVSNGFEQFLTCFSDEPFHSAEEIANATFRALDESPEIQESNIFQFVMDGAASSSFKILKTRFKRCFFTWCAAHCVDLLIEDICKEPSIAATIAQAKGLVTFVMQHQSLLRQFKEYSDGKILLRPAATRFATHFLLIQRLLELRTAVMRLFTSDVFTNWLSKQTSEVQVAVEAHSQCASVLFFQNKLEPIHKLLVPFIQLLRNVDGTIPGFAGKMYFHMFVLQEEIRDTLLLPFPAEVQEFVNAKFAKRWKKMHNPIYSVGYMLDPEFRDKRFEHFQNDEIMNDWNDSMDKFFPGRRAEIDQELTAYFDGIGSFSQGLAKELQLNPRSWWQNYGRTAPNLQRFALQLFAQPVSASSCERNWSIFSWILGQRRHSMGHDTLRKAVAVYTHDILKSRKRCVDIKNIAAFPWITDNIDVIEDDDPVAALFNILHEEEVEAEMVDSRTSHVRRTKYARMYNFIHWSTRVLSMNITIIIMVDISNYEYVNLNANKCTCVRTLYERIRVTTVSGSPKPLQK